MKRGRVHSESGQATIEFTSMTFWLVLAAVFAWQLGLVGWSFISATNAARTAARLYSRTGDKQQAEDDAKKSLSGFLSKDADAHFDGDRAVVNVPIPLFFPNVNSGLVAKGDAEMPHTG